MLKGINNIPFYSRKLLLSFFVFVFIVTLGFIYLPVIIFGAGSQLLIDRVSDEPKQSTTLNTSYRDRTITFNYTGGTVYVTTCTDQACSWAIDDAAKLTVTRPDTTQVTRDLISDTQDKPAENVTSMFQVGTNTVRIDLIDRFTPLKGLPKPLYLVESATPLPAPKPPVKSIPTALSRANHPFILHSKDPVNSFTGSFTLNRTDIAIKGRGPAPTFSRSYDSSNNLDGPLGQGWIHNYAMQLVSPDATTSDIVLIGTEGRADRFTFNSGNYTAPAGIYMTLVKNANGTYTVTHKDQTTWSFDETGKLLRITDRFGNQSTLGYDSNGRLVSVSDPAGRGSLTIVNDGSGKITSIKDWTNREFLYGYDGSGRLSTVTDREGKVTTYTYDGTSQRIATIKDANNNITVTNTYDGSERVATQKDAKGLTTGQQTTFAYNTNGDGTKTTVITYPKTSFESTWSFVEEDTYDTQGRIIKKVSKPVSNSANWITQEYTYDSNGNRSSFKDGRGNTTNFCYDVDYAGATVSGSRGNLTRTIEPAPASGGNVLVTLNKFDDKNNLIQTVSPKGVTSGTTANCSTNFASSINTTYALDYTYDANKITLIALTRRYNEPSVGLKTAITKYEYTDSANPGLQTKEIAPRGNTGGTPDYTYATVNTYFTTGNKAGMLESTTIPSGAVTKYDYDAVGRKTVMIDPKGNVSGGNPTHFTWQYTYDNEDRPRLVKAPAPVAGQAQLITETRYDAVGNKTSVIDANGQVTRYLYDERDSLKEVHQSQSAWTDPSVNPSGMITTAYQYDNLGNLTRMTRAKGNASQERVTDFVFDGLNRVMKETQYPNWPTTTLTLVTTYNYDKNNNQSSVVDPLGKTTNFGYDTLNRQTSITYNSSTTPNVTNSYDANGNRTQMVDGTGTTTFTYDELDRMLSAQTPGPKTVAYRYDLDGNRAKILYPDTTAVTYTYDKANRLTSLVDWSSRTTSYEYFIDGTTKKLNNQMNGTSTEYTYDNANRLTQVWNRQGSSNTISRHTYTMDANGNRTHIDLVPPSDSSTTIGIDYTYDKLNELTKETRPNKTIDYTYDTVGNKLSEKTTEDGDVSTINYTYDRADRIATSVNPDMDYIVDANGNITKRNFAPIGTTDIAFTYDQENRMITVKNFTYSYDGDGKRTKIVKNSTVQDTFIYDVNQELPQLLQDNTHKYVYGLDLVYTVATTSNHNNEPYIYHADGLGSIQALSDTSTVGGPLISPYYEYSSYGFEGVGSISPLNEQPFRFTGEQKDTVFLNEELLYLRSRYYYPKIGRFMSRDPFPGVISDPLTLNRYTYTKNNPTNYTDPSGQWVDTVADIGFIAYDVYRLLTDDGKNQALREENLTSLKWNIVGAVIPGATGLGAASRVARGAVHGNDVRNTAKTWGYSLRDKTTGEVQKIGETMHPGTRYSKTWLRDNNLDFVSETSGTKLEMRVWEHEQLGGYVFQNQALPALNKGLR